MLRFVTRLDVAGSLECELVAAGVALDLHWRKHKPDMIAEIDLLCRRASAKWRRIRMEIHELIVGDLRTH